MNKQNAVTLVPGTPGRLMVSDLLPVILAANDVLHAQCANWSRELSDPQKYVRDFRTIRFDMGQRTGKTYAVSVLAKPGDLVVDLTHDRAKRTTVADGVTCVGLSELQTSVDIASRVYPTIWFVDYSLWPRVSMKMLRDLLISNYDQRMIILG